MVDSVYRTRSLGVALEGIPDQYADGKAAKVWEVYIGSKQVRTDQYKKWLVDILRASNCKNILDVACGQGVDSIMLLEEGFSVTSTDASDKMLKYALTERWGRRKEEAFDKWVIEECNWTSLEDDLTHAKGVIAGGFDAVICLGNSFSHLPDFEGQQRNQKIALKNFKNLIKPGGLLLIDHRNYDEILGTGLVPAKNVYYNSRHTKGIKCSNLYVDGRPTMVTMDYVMDFSSMSTDPAFRSSDMPTEGDHHFRLSYYPHRLEEFKKTLKEIFGDGVKHQVFGDFRPLGEIERPAYYIHLIEKL